MTKRTLAVATLAALPLATGALRADGIRSTDAAATRSVAEHDARPQWTYVLGEGPQMLACPMGGWRCVLYAL
ncbi:MAG: hypothetical protein OXC71_07620 [Chloroflexi bacterium]|nr:hypothetical protein [Chloroflexota bacterium]